MTNQIEKNTASLDLHSVLKKFDNDFDLFQTVAEVYIEDYQNYLKRIEASLQIKDSNELGEASHALKGAASNFSSSLVTATAAQMEAFGREGKIEDANKLLGKLHEESDYLKIKLSEFIANKTPA